jgi:VWFA-related protein
MTRVAIALAAAVFSSGLQAPPSRTLTVDFVALDKDGRTVADLKPEDVEVRIGQFRAPVQRMTVVTPEADERGGRIIVLLLDDMTLRLDSMPRAREAARLFVTRMGANDRVAVLTMTGAKMDATNERARLLQAIDAYSVRATPVMRSDTLGRHVLDTLADISSQMVEAPGRRKTIVAIGSGWLFDRPLPPPAAGQDLLPEWVRAMRAMALSHVNLYVIDPSGVGTARVDAGDAGFARETGGHAFFNTNDLNGAADRILRESANFYMVDVPDPPVGGKADLREVNLKSLRRGVTLRARHAIPGSF